MIILDLPLAPSVNEMTHNVARGRGKTRVYKAWIAAAGWECNIQRPGKIAGTYTALILLPEKMPGDADNRIKATLDLLVKQGITADDRRAYAVTAKRDPDVPAGRMQVVLSAHGGA